MEYDVLGNSGPGLGHSHKSGGVKLVKEIIVLT